MAFKSRSAHRLPDISAATALYIGETAVDAAYLGTTSVFSGLTAADPLTTTAADPLTTVAADPLTTAA